MTKRNEVYKCPECGNIVEVLVPADKDMCGFEQLKENTTDAATEKHVPVVEKIEGGYRVTVGEVLHPMTEAHYIQMIELITSDNEVLRKYLTPEDKPVAEGSVSRISTWIIAALRNEQFFSLESLNREIRKKLEEYNNRPFAAKEGSRSELFRDEELPLLAPLPATPYELASWKKAKVQFNYHITVDFMHYSCPYGFIGKEVDVRVTDSAIEIFYQQNRVASHKRLRGRKGQYSTIPDHMPEKHQHYQEWNGDRFISIIRNGTVTGSANGPARSGRILTKSLKQSLPPKQLRSRRI